MSSPPDSERGSCGSSLLQLPVIPGDTAPHVRRSRSTRWRFAVLIAVQVLMIAHLIQWLLMGRTMSPIEPSESMEAVKNGIINAGAIFFLLALLSTLILGRWMCGWACHVVLLQDWCAAMLKRIGIRPRPFRSRLLMFVPLLLALYMFVWPPVYRLAIAPYMDPQLQWPGFTLALTTNDFWRTFPGVMVAIPFLLICGFGCVYLLGAKGYCTYGCPYGGFFAPLDELAVGRIRVTDDCEHCGHCTAVCTSNVRVHEEVRDFGAVVDPGCMKCMDCVSVCPNDALYYGMGAPAIVTRKSPRTDVPATRRWDLTWPQEIALALVAFVTFMSVYGPFPLLMASGITACVVFLVWISARVVTSENVSMHGLQLRLRGRVRLPGVAILALTALLAVGVIHSGLVRSVGVLAGFADDRVTIPAELVFSASPRTAPPSMQPDVRSALRGYERASFIGDGGWGLLWTNQTVIDVRKAWLHSTLGEFDTAEQILRRSRERYGSTQPVDVGLVRVMRTQGRFEEASAFVEEVFAEHPDYVALADEHIAWLDAEGEIDRAIRMARAVHDSDPDAINPMRRLSLLLVQHGQGPSLDEGVALVERTLEIEPENAFGWYALALGYGRQDRLDLAESTMRRAVETDPSNPVLLRGMAQLLIGLGRPDEAVPYQQSAAALEAAMENDG